MADKITAEGGLVNLGFNKKSLSHWDLLGDNFEQNAREDMLEGFIGQSAKPVNKIVFTHEGKTFEIPLDGADCKLVAEWYLHGGTLECRSVDGKFLHFTLTK